MKKKPKIGRQGRIARQTAFLLRGMAPPSSFPQTGPSKAQQQDAGKRRYNQRKGR